MRFTDDELSDIYDRTSGYCHLCHKKLSFKNYGRLRARGNWEVEHSHPQVHGGTHRLNNLYAACIACNRSKGAFTTRTARKWSGNTKAPLSRSKRRQAKTKAAVATGIFGAAIGGAIGGPPGAWIGGALGARLGYKANPDR